MRVAKNSMQCGSNVSLMPPAKTLLGARGKLPVADLVGPKGANFYSPSPIFVLGNRASFRARNLNRHGCACAVPCCQHLLPALNLPRSQCSCTTEHQLQPMSFWNLINCNCKSLPRINCTVCWRTVRYAPCNAQCTKTCNRKANCQTIANTTLR